MSAAPAESAAPVAPRPATVVPPVHSQPSGATVRDGALAIGQTPLEVRLPASAAASYTLERDGYRSRVVRIEAVDGRGRDIEVVLTREGRRGDGSAPSAPAVIKTTR
ncbi:MAG: hypothetical protein U1F43_13445 [Myxococcota bacterium]